MSAADLLARLRASAPRAVPPHVVATFTVARMLGPWSTSGPVWYVTIARWSDGRQTAGRARYAWSWPAGATSAWPAGVIESESDPSAIRATGDGQAPACDVWRVEEWQYSVLAVPRRSVRTRQRPTASGGL